MSSWWPSPSALPRHCHDLPTVMLGAGWLAVDGQSARGDLGGWLAVDASQRDTFPSLHSIDIVALGTKPNPCGTLNHLPTK